MFDNTGDSRIVDEWTFGQYQSVATATSALQAHWASWITEADFVAIAAAGLNHVRIPIGYWAFDVSAGEPYIKSTQYSYLKQAVQWAANHGIYVIVGMSNQFLILLRVFTEAVLCRFAWRSGLAEWL